MTGLFRNTYAIFAAALLAAAASGCGAKPDEGAGLSVEGAEEQLVFEAEPRAGSEIFLTSSQDWTVTNNISWLEVIPDHGRRGESVMMLVLPQDNRSDKQRAGTFSINSGTEHALVRIRQEAAGARPDPQDPDDPEPNRYKEPEPQPFDPGGDHRNPTDNTIIAWWTLGENDYMDAWDKANETSWRTHGTIPADWPAGSKADMTWSAGTDAVTPRTFILSSDGNGHWAVKPTWTDDSFTFSVPSDGLKAGDRLSIRFGISGVSSVPRYWMVEYCADGTTWTAVSKSAFTQGGETIDATFRLTEAGKVHDVDLSVTLDQAVTGSFKFRLRCVSGKFQTGGGTATQASEGSAVRIRPMTEAYDSQKGISIRLNAND